MAFFLLGRTEDGTLSLLSHASFSTRQDALAELSRITGRSSFDRWSEDVLLLDLDAATPVLLVRPTFAPQPEPETEPLSQAETAGVVEAEPVVAGWADPRTEPVGDPAIADMIVEEAAGEMPGYVETVESSAPVESDQSEEEPAPEEMLSLRDALARTAVQMESTGVVATQSVGPAESTGQSPEEPAPDQAPTGEMPEEPVSESAYSVPEDGESAQDAPVGEVEFAATVTEPQTVPDPEPIVSHEVTAWPWDIAAAETEPATMALPHVERAYVTTPLEEPALDDGSILRGSIDDDMFAAARPVILGAYPEVVSTAPETVPAVPETVPAVPESVADTVTEPMGTVDALLTIPLTDSEPAIDLSDFELVSPAKLEPAVSAQPPDPDLGAQADPSDGAADEISDFILDLDAVTIVPPEDEEASVMTSEPTVSPRPEYMCVDCVYVETCPNKDQRLPSDCGTFQWR